MKLPFLSLPIAALALATTAFAQTPTPTPMQPSAPSASDANNTDRNAGDGSAGASTADQQPNNPSDLKLVQAIRQGVIADNSLSMSAKNCKIIVRDGAVTLRGPVDSEQERSTIVKIASDLAGKDKVTDSLEVKLAAR